MTPTVDLLAGTFENAVANFPVACPSVASYLAVAVVSKDKPKAAIGSLE